MRLPYAQTLLARPNGRIRFCAAFTIIETLVSLFAVALLTTVVLISLRAVRADMTNTTDLMNLGLTAKDFFAYASDHSGQLPYAGLPSEAEAAPWFYGGSPDAASRASQYLMHATYWPVVLFQWSGQAHMHWLGTSGAAWGIGSEHMRHEWDEVGSDRQAWMPTAFVFGSSLWTSTQVWEGEGIRFASPLAYEPHYQKHSLASFLSPSSKGMLLYRAGARSGTHWQTAFGDGHVGEHGIGEYRPAATMPLSHSPQPGIPVLHTRDGIRGRDM